ncbi:MAG: hypothetical protein QOC77_2870 [Thermoleophilaceae bacterium]|jgi:hypothetical protein|nr:hypothetical protein [Thermoleophilaceae bacterium]MEA2469724.1 hypothetical protein [Thermoleophilaceae bacterium]
MSVTAQSRTATQVETGRPCPYCRFPLKDGIEVVECGGCAAVHHEDCWGDNHGCAIVGCVGGPSRAPASSPPPPPSQRPATRQAPPPAVHVGLPPVAPPPKQPVSRGPWLIAAIVILAIAIAGAAAAYVITSKKDKPATAQVSRPSPSPSTTTDATPPAPNPTAGVPASTPSSVLPAETRSQMKSDIESLLLQWHNDIVGGDYRSAWNLLTPRKRAQKLREDGYPKWARSQATLGNNLDPSGLSVSILKVDDATGVVTVNVHGMRLITPIGNCTYWSGVTWVRYENGQWLYEPGFSMTRARRAYWQPRKTQTLGGSC